MLKELLYWKEIFENHVSGKGLIPRKYIECFTTFQQKETIYNKKVIIFQKRQIWPITT